MKNVLVIGANGQVGKRIIDKLESDERYKPVAFVRKEEQLASFSEQGIEARLGDLEASVQDIGEQMADIDAVVFSAGSGGSTGADKTLLIDLDGAVKSMEAALEHHIDRFIIVSAMGADQRSTWTTIKPYYVAKHFADKSLIASGLTYTIVRPGLLIDEDGEGQIKEITDTTTYDGNKDTYRGDVASLVVASIDNENAYNKAIDFVSGDVMIEDALNKL